MTPLLAIRIAMVSGVLLFGGVTWFLRQSGTTPGLDAAGLQTLLWVARCAWALAIGGCVALFSSIRRATTPSRERTLSIVGWGLGEMVALLGGVIWYLTGVTTSYFLGLAFLVLTYLAFPAGQR